MSCESDTCKIHIESLQQLENIGEQLGRGARANSVDLYKHKLSHTFVAVKSISRQHTICPLRVMTEKKALSLLHHKLIVQLLATFKDESKLYFVFELISSGHIGQQIRAYNGGSGLPYRTVQFYAAEIALAVEYLHQCKVWHRDLKPSNIMLRRNGHVCLIDLGSAAVFSDHDSNSSRRRHSIVGTPEYWAPERCRREDYTSAVDWWSLGVILYEMIFGHFSLQSNDIYSNQSKCNYTMEDSQIRFRPECTPEVREILSGLLHPDATSRWCFKELRKCAFFNSTNWSSLVESSAPTLPVNDLGCLTQTISECNDQTVDNNTDIFLDF